MSGAWASFVQTLSPDEVDIRGEPESLAQVREGRVLLVLAHEKDAEGTHCVFLGEGGCTVHEHRPMACRAYPFDRPDDAPQTHHALGLHPDHMCPPDTQYQRTADADPQQNELARDYRKWVIYRDREASEHALWLQEWNRRQRTRTRLGRLPQTKAELLEALGLT